jgi:hypothetical protein
MASNEYHFITEWRMEGTVEEAYRLLADAPDLVRWWPTVYLDVRELSPGGPNGFGKVVSLHTKGWLPYTLRWQYRVTEVRFPEGFGFRASGDFVGRGIWRFHQDGKYVKMTFDWKIRADKPLLRYLSFVAKPIFSANHRWAMAQGEKSLRAELARRRLSSESQSRDFLLESR